jgi:uncharacterized protein (DUF58 family)
LPNGKTLGLGAVLVAMWYAGSSQANGAAYLLCFVLAALAVVSTIHAWANLRGIQVVVEPIAPVFAGEEMAVPLAVSSSRRRSHFGIRISDGAGKNAVVFSEIAPAGVQRGTLSFPAVRRGCFREVRLRVSSLFPLGFFTASQRLVLAQTHYIYPAPHGAAPLPRTLAPTRQPRDGTRREGDDFGGVRAWREGESQRHIDWKAAARGQPLLTKQWTGEADEIMDFDWQTLAPLEVEARLSQLAKWVVVAERGGATYALRLPGTTLEAARGDRHFHQCLRALAAFESDERAAVSSDAP